MMLEEDVFSDREKTRDIDGRQAGLWLILR